MKDLVNQLARETKSRTILLITILAIFVGTTNGFGLYLFSVLNFEMQSDLRFGQTYAGLAAGTAQGSLMFASFVFGMASPKITSMKWILIGFYALSVLMLLGMGLVTHWIIIIPLMTLAGIVGAVVWLAAVALTKNLIAKNHQGKALGAIAATGTSFFIFLNGIAVPIVTTRSDWRTVWLLAGVLSALFLFLGASKLLTFRVFNPSKVGPKSQYTTSIRISKFLTPIAITIFVMGILNGLTFIPFMTFLNSYLQTEAGWTANQAAHVWSYIGLGAIFGGLAFGYFSDIFCARNALIVAYVLAILTIFCTLISNKIEIVYPAIFIFGLAYAPVFGQSAAYISKTQSSENSDFLNSLFYVAFGLGSMFGNAAVGYSGDQFRSLFPAYLTIMVAMLMLIFLTTTLKSDR